MSETGLRLSLLLALTACSAPQQPFELTILHTNDTHARIAEVDRFGSTCDAEASAAGTCFGGVARRFTAIERVRAEAPNTLLLDAGDQFQGTLFFRMFRGDEARRFMNHLAYDAMSLGNHEFDGGTEPLGRFVAGLDFPVVITNLDSANDPLLSRYLVPWAIVELGGERIGLLGCLTEETVTVARPGDTVDFLPIEPALDEGIAELTGQGIDVIVLMSHSGLERDRRIAATVGGIDVIVGGHTNILLANDSPDSDGPYPVVVEGPEGPVLIVQSFTWGKYLGRLDVVFDPSGRPLSWSGDSILLDFAIPEDPATLAQVHGLAGKLGEATQERIGETRVRLVGQEKLCRGEECNLGNLIADALLEAHRGQGVEIALQNSGGIRSSLAAGPITLGRLLEVLPFPNTASVFGLRGTDLLAVLEHGVSRAHNLESDGTGRFLQVAGLRYSWSPSRPVGDRVIEAEVLQSDGTWNRVDESRTYRVVSNDFTRNGGDAFEILVHRAIDPYDVGQPVADLVADHIRANSPLQIQTEGRIRRTD